MIRRLIGIPFLAVTLLTFLAATSTAATQADAAKLDIQAGDPAVDPKTPVVNETATVAFIVNLYSLNDQNVEQPAANVKSQSYTLTANDSDGSLQQVTAEGFTVTIAANSRSATITANGGNSTPSISIKANVKYSSTGNKSVTLSGTVTFNDNSALSGTKTVSFKVVDVRVDFAPAPINTIMPFTDTTGATIQKPTRVTATVAPASATNDISFSATGIPLAFPPDSTRFTITEVSRDTSTGKILLDILGTAPTPKEQPAGDVKLQAVKAGNMIAETFVIVIVPAQFDIGGIKNFDESVTGKNVVLNSTTTPAVANVMPPQALLVSTYGVIVNIPINDQFGRRISALYAGAAIEESIDSGAMVPLNLALSAAGTYADPSGFPVNNKLVNLDTDGEEVSAWLNSDGPLPFTDSGQEVAILRVKVGGFGIVKSIRRSTTYAPDPPPSSPKAKITATHTLGP